jgi:hypothetical protein
MKLLAELEFSDPDKTGFIDKEQLYRTLSLFDLKELPKTNMLDILTKERLSMDYLRYLVFK